MRRLIALTCLALLLAVSLPTQAQVHDQAGFFTPQAVERANQLISQFRSQTKHDFVVETIPTVPDAQRAQLDSMGKERFFTDYARQFAQQDRTSGVFVLICRDPSYLKVAVGDNTMRTGLFTAGNRDQLASTLLSSFRAKNYDQGLMNAVEYVQQTVTSNAQNLRQNGSRTLQTFPGQSPAARTSNAPAATPPPQQQPTGGHGMLWWVIVLGGGFLLLMFIVRRIAARASAFGGSPTVYGPTTTNVPPPLPGQRTGYGAYPGYGAGSGGGFGRGLLGGLLGGAAGGWLYDRVSHRNDPGSYPGQAPTNPGGGGSFAPPDPYDAPPDRDFSVSSGGDFSDPGGGGSDFSAGGGGDFGGGGGGGDSSGGSF